MKREAIKLFEHKKIRTVWDDEKQDWWFSVVDVIAILTDSPRPRKYWNDLKIKLIEEGSKLSVNTGQLKLEAADGKKYLTDVSDTEQLLRLVQSIPSKKAEPFKLWLAKVGKKYINEAADPELAINRAVNNYRRLGYSENWINQRLKTIEARKMLTDEWDKSGVKRGKEYADLTDLMYKTWAGMNTRQYKNFKGLKKESLRDNMTNTELVLNMLAEVAATDISVEQQPMTLEGSARVAKSGAEVAKDARKSLERRTGRSALSPLNAKAYLTNGDQKGLKDE